MGVHEAKTLQILFLGAFGVSRDVIGLLPVHKFIYINSILS